MQSCFNNQLISLASDQSKYYLRFEINELPPTLNRLNILHRFARYRMSKKWQTQTIEAVGDDAPLTPLKRAFIRITRYSSTEPDGDNMTGAYKSLVDGLRKAGVIENDKMSNIGNIQTPWIKAPKKQGKIVVEVWEV